MNKSKLYSLIAVLALTGCAYHNMTPPVDVRLVPNDCANQRLIENYLVQQTKRSRNLFETESDYEDRIKDIRGRIWNMRYHCNPV